MRLTKIRFELCAMVLFIAVVFLPYAGITQGRLNRPAPNASDRPVMTADGGDPVPRLPQPPKKQNGFTA